MIEVEKCPCSHRGCKDYHLKGIGKFVQGSGFSLAEANYIADLLNEAAAEEAREDWMSENDADICKSLVVLLQTIERRVDGIAHRYTRQTLDEGICNTKNDVKRLLKDFGPKDSQ